MSPKSVIFKLNRCILAFIVLMLVALVVLNAVDKPIFSNAPVAPAEIIEPISDTDISVLPEPELEPEPEPKPESQTATLMFGGDVLIHSSIYKQAKTGGKTYNFIPYFEYFTDVFKADYNCINLELPVDALGGNKDISTYPCFNAPIELLDALKTVNVQLCTNSNNHMLDRGYDGLVATKQHLNDYGFDSLGTYTSQEEHDTLFIKDINGIKVGFCAYTQTTNDLKLSSDKEKYAFDRMGIKAAVACDDILPRVKALREAGAEVIITVLHWGTEYNSFPSTAQTNIAKGLCEGGVDIIIGSHPHVVQPIEKLTVTREDGTEHECLVVYSLGNLFCNQRTKPEQTRQSMVVGLKLLRDESGKVKLDDAFYMPTLLCETGQSKDKFLRLVTPAKYIDSEDVPEVLQYDIFKALCRNAWRETTGTVGEAIPAVTDPSHYPEGFFE